MSTFFWLQPLAGGVLIGAASLLLWAGLGRIAGISGIASRALAGVSDAQGRWRWYFLVGLVAAGAITQTLMGSTPLPMRPWPMLLAAGALVGVGTVLGSGCTSGHGVCGLGRRSLRSLVATAVFMMAGMLTASVLSGGAQ